MNIYDEKPWHAFVWFYTIIINPRKALFNTTITNHYAGPQTTVKVVAIVCVNDGKLTDHQRYFCREKFASDDFTFPLRCL